MGYAFLKVSDTGLLKTSDTGYLIVGGAAPQIELHSIKVLFDNRELIGNNDENKRQL